MQMKKKAAGVLLVAALLATAACGSSKSSSATTTTAKTALPAGDPIKVAGLVALSGGAAPTYGASFVKAVNYVFDKVNAAGGVEMAGKTHKIEYTPFDDQQSGAAAPAAARKALDAGYQIILGPNGSGATSAVQPLMAESIGKTVWLIAPPIVAGPTQNSNVFRPAALGASYNTATFDWLKKHPEVKKIAMITDQKHTGFVQVTQGLVDGIKALGREVVAQEQMQTGDTDFRAPIAKILNLKPDLFMQRGYPAEISLLLKQTRELGSNVAVQWNTQPTKSEVEQLGITSLIEGVTSTNFILTLDTFVADKNPLALDMLKVIGEGGSFSTTGFDSATILVAALQKATGPTATEVGKALAELKPEDLKGKTLNTFGATAAGTVFDHGEVNASTYAVEWKGGGWVFAK
jgi:branched-chain amino acid transport system substrate-binding protein